MNMDVQEFRVFNVFKESRRVWLVNENCKGESVVWGDLPYPFIYGKYALPEIGQHFMIPVREGFNMPTGMDFAVTLKCYEPRMLYPDVPVEMMLDAFEIA